MAAVVAAGAWDAVRDTGITSASGPLDAQGRSVAVFTDVLQRERQITCASTNADSKRSDLIPPATLNLVIDDDGNEWYLIGFEPEGRDGMTIRCTPRDKGSDNATYAYSVIDGFTARARAGDVIAAASTGLGIALAIWTFITRRRDGQEATDASA